MYTYLRWWVVGLLCVGWLVPGGTRAQSADTWRTDFSRHTVPLDEIVSGGPPKDGIPAIDQPVFVSTQEADQWLGDREPVIVVAMGADVRAYPLQILMWHEIVNDRVGGVPVTITYCPLCNTALVFDRRFNEMVLDFGTTGRLRHSDLVMYDRQTESWWQQATGEGIVGELAGKQLVPVSAPTVSWSTFKSSHPDGRVLSRETGHDRPYGRNPYTGYDDPDGTPWSRFFRKPADDRMPAMERIVAMSSSQTSLAYPFTTLRRRRVMNDQMDGRPIVVFWAPGTASAVDAANIAGGRDVGSSGVFGRRAGGRTLTFEAAGDGLFRDRQTGSTWTIVGSAIAGPLTGTALEPIPHGNHFWFAWAAFKPDTKIRR